MQTVVVSTQRAMPEAQATDHEYVRLMFLVKFPDAIVALTSIRNGLDRDQLDAVHLGSDETIDAMDPYRFLSTIYNNRDPDYEFNRKCHNPCVKKRNEVVVVADPLEDGNTFDALFSSCKHMDPNHPDIPERDHQWIKTHLKNMEKVLSEIARKFRESGQQRGFDVFSEWSTFFCDGAPAWAKLSIAILDYLEMDSWSYHHSHQEERRARQRELNRKRKARERARKRSLADLSQDSGAVVSSLTSPGSAGEAATTTTPAAENASSVLGREISASLEILEQRLEQAAERNREINMLMYALGALAKSDDPVIKEEAIQQLVEIKNKLRNKVKF